jgi:hypothetical protein
LIVGHLRETNPKQGSTKKQVKPNTGVENVVTAVVGATIAQKAMRNGLQSSRR